MKRIFSLLLIAIVKVNTLVAQVGSQVNDQIDDVKGQVGETFDTAKELISPTKVLTILLVILFLWLFNKLLNFAFGKLAENFNRQRLRILRIQPIVNIFVYFVVIYALIVVLFHPTAEAVYALMASSALALGFAAQDILKNVFGGLLVILGRPFQIGDRVNVKDNYGEVVKIGLRSTDIRTLDDSVVTIPNSTFINESVSNANTGALDCMVVIDLWLPIDINVQKVRSIAHEATITSRYLNIDKDVTILFFDHFDNVAATNVKIKAYVLDARYEKAFEGDVTEAAKKAFIEHNIYKRKSA